MKIKIPDKLLSKEVCNHPKYTKDFESNEQFETLHEKYRLIPGKTIHVSEIFGDYDEVLCKLCCPHEKVLHFFNYFIKGIHIYTCNLCGAGGTIKDEKKGNT